MPRNGAPAFAILVGAALVAVVVVFVGAVVSVFVGSGTLRSRRPSRAQGCNEPARIRDAASAAVESDLRRATTSEGSGSGMGKISGRYLL
jgi:hypothetical protein